MFHDWLSFSMQTMWKICNMKKFCQPCISCSRDTVALPFAPGTPCWAAPVFTQTRTILGTIIPLLRVLTGQLSTCSFQQRFTVRQWKIDADFNGTTELRTLCTLTASLRVPTPIWNRMVILCRVLARVGSYHFNNYKHSFACFVTQH